MNNKVCTTCKLPKHPHDFNNCSKTSGGKRARCRSCESDIRQTPEILNQRYDRDLQKKYGITIGDYNAMFLSQEGSCKICKAHQTGLKKKLVVDHCHSTGKVRGLLCDKCNRGIGFLGDTTDMVYQAYIYLFESEE